jgi:WD40 repeat protein
LVRIWDATPLRDGEVPGDELVTLTGPTNGVKALAFHPTEPVLVAGGTDGKVLAWDARNWSAPPRTVVAGAEPVHALAYDPAGGWLAVGGSAEQKCVILGAADGATRARLQLEGPWGPHRLSASADSQLVAGCDQLGKVVVWDAATGKTRLAVHTLAFAYGVAFGRARGRPLLAVASTAGKVSVFDPTTGREVTSFDHPGATGVAFRPDGDRLASVAWDNSVRLWRTDTWALAEQYRDPGGQPNSVAFSPDGTLLAWGGADTTVKVWKVGAGQVATLRGHRNWVWDVAFRPGTGDVIASAGRDGTVKVWKTPKLDPE